MDVFDDRFIDVGLNAVGYLAAGLLWTLVYSAFTRKSRLAASTDPQAAVVSGSDAPLTTEASTSDERRRLEFVTFRQPKPPRQDADERNRPGTATETASRHRDKAEIIRLARQMLASGASEEKIKKTLPIGDGELALLDQRNR
jgi:hypothetical protein